MDTNSGFIIKQHWIRTALIALAGAAALFFANLAVAEYRGYGFMGGGSGEATLDVMGEGEVEATPDMAEVELSVESLAGSAKTAQDTLALKTANITAALKTRISDADIRTENYTVYDNCNQYDDVYGSCTSTNYTARQTIRATVKTLDSLSAVLQDAVNKGAYISNVQLTFRNIDALNAQAEKIAIENAKAKAKATADTLGVRIGRVVSFDNYGDYDYDYAKETDYAFTGSRSTTVPTIPIGNQKIRTQVSVTFAIH